MLSNTSSSGEGAADSSKSSGVRKLVKRNNRQSDSQPQQQLQKPKISRLGMKSAGEGDSDGAKRSVRRLGGDGKSSSKTPESSNVSSIAGGSDSEWSDKKFDINVADDWNRRTVTEKVDDSWDDCGETWDDLNIEPACSKKKMYKCGPVTDEEEPQVFPRLQAPGTFKDPKKETRRFKNPEMNYLEQEVVEKNEKPLNYEKQETIPKPSFLEGERQQNFKQQQRPPGPPPQSSWLRGSWLENVSKSVASLTAQVSQNISAALDTETPPPTEDLRQLVSERLKDYRDPTEESPRKGRKYLHKVGIEDDIRPVYAFQQKIHDTNRQSEVPSNVLKNTQMHDNKPQWQSIDTASSAKQVRVVS